MPRPGASEERQSHPSAPPGTLPSPRCWKGPCFKHHCFSFFVLRRVSPCEGDAIRPSELTRSCDVSVCLSLPR